MIKATKKVFPDFSLVKGKKKQLKLLPEGTLGYFDLVNVQEIANKAVIYLEEKNVVSGEYSGQ